MIQVTVIDLMSLERKIKAVEAYMASDEFQMLRESTQQDYKDYLLGMKMRFTYLKIGRR